MSSNLVPTKVALITDPRLMLNNERIYGVLRGGNNVSWQQFPVNGTPNTSNIQITCNPPSRRHVINRRVYLNVTFMLTFSGVSPQAPAGALLQQEFDGPRAYPLSSIISSQTMTFANSSVQLGNFQDYWPLLLRYHNDFASQDLNYGMTPSQMDFYQNYADWQISATLVPPAAPGMPISPYFGYGGSARNPLASAGENSVQMTRAGFSGLNITTNTSVASPGLASATAILTVTEPVYMSPLIFARGDSESGITNIEQMTYTATLGNLANIWSHGTSNLPNGATINSINVTIKNAQLLFEYLEPSTVSSIPAAISYPWFTPQVIITNNIAMGLPITPGSSAQFSTLSVQLSGVPRRMYLFARKPISSSTYTDSDVSMNINQVTVNFDSNTYLSQATENDLYQMSRKNGINMSWSQWQKYSGSVFCAEFGTDIGMSPMFAPGTLGTHQLQVTGTVKNINLLNSITPTIYLIIIYEGTLSCIDGTVFQQSNVLTNEDALTAQPMAGANYKHSETIYGGDFFSTLKNVGKLAYQGVKAMAPIARTITGLIPHPGAQAANRVLTSLGASLGGRLRHAMGRSGGRMRRHRSSRMMRGGAMGDCDEKDEQDEQDEQVDQNLADAAENAVSFADEHGQELEQSEPGSSEEEDAVEQYLRHAQRQ